MVVAHHQHQRGIELVDRVEDRLILQLGARAGGDRELAGRAWGRYERGIRRGRRGLAVDEQPVVVAGVGDQVAEIERRHEVGVHGRHDGPDDRR